MTTVEMPTERFRLSMLLYDTRYRSLTIQVIALLAFMLAAAWLVNNTVQNLAALGKTFNFGFLWQPRRLRHQPAPDPLYQRRHPRPRGARRHPQHLARRHPRLHPRHRHRRAHRRAAALDELARRPARRRLRRHLPQRPGAALDPRLHGGPDRHGAGAHGLPRRQRHRAHALRRRSRSPTAASTSPGRSSRPGWQLVVALLRSSASSPPSPSAATPRARQEATGEILPTFWIKLGAARRADAPRRPARRRPDQLSTSRAQALQLRGRRLHRQVADRALARRSRFYTASFIAEIVRAGIQAVSRGQTEAAARSGLRPGRIMSLVVLPQAMRVIIPPLISQYLNLTKNSSLAIAVGYMDAARHARRHHHEPDRPRARMHAAADGLLPDRQPADLVGR